MPLFVFLAWLSALGPLIAKFAAGAGKLGGGILSAMGGGGGAAVPAAASVATPAAGGATGILGGMAGKAGGASMANLAGTAGPGGAMSAGPPAGAIGQAAQTGASGGSLRALASPAPQTLSVTPGATPPSVPGQAYGTSVTSHGQPGILDKAQGYWDRYQNFKEQLPERRDPPPLQTAALPNYAPQQPQAQGPAWAQWMDKLRSMQASGGLR